MFPFSIFALYLKEEQSYRYAFYKNNAKRTFYIAVSYFYSCLCFYRYFF